MSDHENSRAALRKSVCALLAALSAAAMMGRIAAVDSVDVAAMERERFAMIPRQLADRRQSLAARGVAPERIEAELRRLSTELARRARMSRPFLSANDRSRWNTLRALVEPEMRVYREVNRNGKTVREWVPYAIDKVVALPGWDTIDMVKHPLADDPRGPGYLYSSKPPLLPTLMAAPYWLIYQTTGMTLGSHPYTVGRVLLVLLNVLPLVLYFVLLGRLVERLGTSDWGRIFVLAVATFGTFLTTFAVVLNNHLPAAVSATVALAAAARIGLDQRRRPLLFVVAGLASAFTVACELPAASFCGLLSVVLLWKAPRQTLLYYMPAATVVAAAFFLTNYIAHRDLRPAYAHRAPGDNWYDYTYERNGRVYQSYWTNRVGIDRGEPSRAVYVMHATVGHHGIVSLTPVWLLTVAGLAISIVRPAEKNERHWALLIAAVSIVCLCFYLLMTKQDDRNYGGMTAGFRWVFWLAPLWLVGMVPAADWAAQRRWSRGLALAALGVSVFSASYPTWNPWTHPWLLNYLHYLGWIRM